MSDTTTQAAEPIHVYLAHSGKNPGVNAIAALGVMGDRPYVYTHVIASEVTNFHAAWESIVLALGRLNGRPGILWTTFSAIAGAEQPDERNEPYRREVQRALAASRSVVRFIRKADAPPWMGQAQDAAAEAYAAWLAEQGGPDDRAPAGRVGAATRAQPVAARTGERGDER